MGEIIAVPLFESGHAGFGDSRLVTNPNRYNRIYGSFDARSPGELRMGASFTTLAHSATFFRPPVWVGEARNTSGGAEGRYPAILFAIDSQVDEIVNGAAAARLSASALIAGTPPNPITDCTMHDNGSGVNRLIVAFGDAITIRHCNMFTNSVTGGTVSRDKVASISGALYGSSIPTGAGRFNGISFCPYGADPATAANWSSVTRVGWATTDINAIIGVRGLPCVLKPEGIFIFRRATNQWDNMTPAWEQEPHPNNGRGAVSLGPNIIVPLGRGGAVTFDGYTVKDISPYSIFSAPNQDTTSQLMVALGTYRNWIIGATAVSHGYAGGRGSKELHDLGGFSTYNQKEVHVGNSATEGIRVWRTQDDMATFTSGSTNAGDGSLATTVTMDAQSTAAAGDYLLIGFRYPFRAIIIEFDIGASQANTTISALSAQYASSATAWSSMALYDFTAALDTTSAGSATLGQSGAVVFTGNPTDWTARTIDTDGANFYYIRLAVSVTLSATVRIANIRIIPWRPAIDTTDYANEGIDRAGVYPHLLMGRPGGEDGQSVWHDMGTPAVPDEIGCITVGPVGGATGGNPYKLIMIGRRQSYLYHIQDSDAWPWLDDTGGLYESAVIEPADGRVASLKEVRIFGRDFDGVAVNGCSFFYRYNTVDRWSRLTLGARPPFVTHVNDGTMGTSFQWAIALTMTQTEPIRRPVITGIEADFEVLDISPDKVPQRAIATPQRG